MPNTILIVDDDQGIREALKELLEIEGYHVDTANGGTEGLAYLRANKPSLVLLDLMMPGMGGLEFRENQLAENLAPEVPVVLMSADGQIQKRGEQAQVTEYLKKPMDINEVLALVKRYCGES
ncbi:MAG: response regulator [Proteobacteria bacterium]|nr:MAG: response regulator [Pseudomonadota bacterium]